MKKKRIAVAVSGGVDSLCALLRLVESGHEVIAIHGLFLGASPKSSAKIADRLAKLREICALLSAPLFVADFSVIFAREVIAPFIEAWLCGDTPNPCIRCNQKIKFGLLADYARVLGADLLATGHYAALCKNPYSEAAPLLLRKTSSAKDQTYFLSFVDRSILPRLIFPLAGLSKEECRQMARKYGFAPPEERESQDICFLQNRPKAEFIKKFGAEVNMPGGPIMWHDRKLGAHSGLVNYTIGQRKGLGVPWRAPLYVWKKDHVNNILYVAEREEMLMTGIQVAMKTMFAPMRLWPEKIFAQWRHRGELMPCQIEKNGKFYEVKLAKGCFPTASGQVCAFFDSRGIMLGAGLILKTLI